MKNIVKLTTVLLTTVSLGLGRVPKISKLPLTPR
jgi:hypothetical protein